MLPMKRPSKLTVTRYKCILGFRSGRPLDFWPVPRSLNPLGPFGFKYSLHRRSPRPSLETIHGWLGTSFCFTGEPALRHGAPHKGGKGIDPQESQCLEPCVPGSHCSTPDNKPRLSRRGRTCTGKSRRRRSCKSASSPSVRTPPCAHLLLTTVERGGVCWEKQPSKCYRCQANWHE